jgi:hypothetical protein
MAGRDGDRGKSKRLGAEDRRWPSTGRVLGGQMIERSSNAIYSLHRAQGDKEHSFLSLASKPRSTISPCLASNPVATVLVIWPQNHSLGFFWIVPQNWQLRFGELAHKIITTVSWFSPQNHVGYGLSVAPKHRWEDEDGTGHVSKSSGLLHLEASRARVSQSSIKTDRGVAQMVTWHHHGGHVEMKLKTDGLMRWAASDSSTLTLPFVLY